MTAAEQLFKSLRNTQPKFDYHSDMYSIEFISKNKEIFEAAILRCELDMSMAEIMQAAQMLLPTLPNKPRANYPVQRAEDSPNHEWALSLAHLGSKRDKKNR